MKQNTEAVEGWTVTEEHDNAVFFNNDEDNATVSIEEYGRRNSLANWQIKSQYKGVSETMGRVRACETFEQAVEAAHDYMEERA